MGFNMLAWSLGALLIAVLAAFYLTAKIRVVRAEPAKSDAERAMEEDAYRLARARLIYRRKRKQEEGRDPLNEMFGVDVSTDLRL